MKCSTHGPHGQPRPGDPTRSSDDRYDITPHTALSERRIRGFANSWPTTGGTHERGLHDGLVAAVSAYARKRQLLTATDPDLDADRIGEGLTAVVSVKLDHPEFDGATRGVLGNAAARAGVARAVQEHLGEWLDGHPEQATTLVGQIVQSAR